MDLPVALTNEQAVAILGGLERGTGCQIADAQATRKWIESCRGNYLITRDVYDQGPRPRDALKAYRSLVAQLDAFQADFEEVLRHPVLEDALIRSAFEVPSFLHAPSATSTVIASGSTITGPRMASATSTAPSISDLRSWIHELRENLGVLKEILARSEQSARDWASKRRQGGRWPEFALRDLICELADGYEDLTKGEARGGPFVGFVRSVLVTIEPDEPRYALNRTVERHLKWRADRRAGQQIEGERNRGA